MRWTEEEYQRYRARQQEGAAPSTASSEAQWLAQVRAAARAQGWHTYHTYDSRRSEEGFPDLVCCNGRRILFVELKTDTGKLTPAQQVWLALLRQAGAEVYIWRPRDWEQVLHILGAAARGDAHATPQ